MEDFLKKIRKEETEKRIFAIDSILKNPEYSKIAKKSGKDEAIGNYFSNEKVMENPAIWKLFQERLKRSCEDATDTPEHVEEYMNQRGDIIIANWDNINDGIRKDLIHTANKNLKEVV